MNRSAPRSRPRAAAAPSSGSRERILDAGEALFSRRGLRAVPMEELAREASVAKATLYGHFRDRDGVFAAVAERLAQRLVEGVRNALDGSGPVAERVAAALAWKHRLVRDLTHGSGHAHELLGAKERLARQRFERADRDMIAAVEAVIASESTLSPQARALARAAFFGSQGLAEHPTREATLEVEIEAFVTTLLRGARAAAPRRARSPAPRRKGGRP